MIFPQSQGGFHCGFIDSAIAFCDAGSITRAQQLAITRREMTEFLLLYLWMARTSRCCSPCSLSKGSFRVCYLSRALGSEGRGARRLRVLGANREETTTPWRFHI